MSTSKKVERFLNKTWVGLAVMTVVSVAVGLAWVLIPNKPIFELLFR